MNLRLLAVCLSLPACRVAASPRDVKSSYIVKLCGAPLEREAAAALAQFPAGAYAANKLAMRQDGIAVMKRDLGL